MSNAGFASMFSRWMLGLFVGMIGVFKVFVLTPQVHAQNFFIDGFKDHWIPDFLLWALGYTIPFVELVVGLLILVGIWVRYSTIVVGFLLVLVAYGHLLQDAFYNPTSHLLPRFGLMILVLLLYSEKDQYSAENFFKRK